MTAAGASVETASQATIARGRRRVEGPGVRAATTARRQGRSTRRQVDVTVLNGSGQRPRRRGRRPGPQPRSATARSVGGNADELRLHLERGLLRAGLPRAGPKIAGAPRAPTSVGAPLEPRQAAATRWWSWPAPNFTGTLATPPKAAARPPAGTVDTTSLVDRDARDPQRSAGFPVMAPMKVASGSRRKDRTRRQGRTSGGGGSRRIGEGRLRRQPGRRRELLGIDDDEHEEPPDRRRARPARTTSGGRRYLTYYDGRNLQRLAFQRGGVWYWISNTLKNDLSAKTIEEIAKSMRPLNRAKLAKGTTDTPISVETEGRPRERGRERQRQPAGARPHRRHRGRLRRPGDRRLPGLHGLPGDPARHRRAQGGRAQRRAGADLRARPRRPHGRAPRAADLHALARAHAGRARTSSSSRSTRRPPTRATRTCRA